MESGATSQPLIKEKGVRKNRSWSKQEERVLFDGLKELVTMGYKCDNGFKSGYMTILEKELMKAFPKTDLRVKPHIDSKIHVWKRFYYSLSQMFGKGFNGTGVGVMNSEYKIDATEEKWISQVKSDPSARALRNKSFPYYEDWKEIFGKDRAGGEDAQTYPDIVEETKDPSQKESPIDVDSIPETPPFTENFNVDFQSFDRDEGSSATKTSKGRKRKIQVDDPMVERLGEFFNRTDIAVENMTTKIVDELGEGRKKREGLFAVLQGYDFITPDEILGVAQYMAKNPHELDMWWSYPNNFKIAAVKRIIKEL